MTVADYFLQKCTDALEEDVALLLDKLSDPASLVDVNMTDALGNDVALGDLASLAGSYVSNNAQQLTAAAIGMSGLNKNSSFAAFNTFLNLFANSVSAYNDLILLYLKKIAEQIVSGLNQKIAINKTVKGDLTGLVNALTSMNQGPDIFEAYLTQLRAALILVDEGRRDIQLTTNTLAASNTFLTKTFRKGKKEILAAQSLIKPLSNNPYLKPTAQSLALNLGIPDIPTQISNILALPKLCQKIISDAKNYGTTTLLVNAQITFYFAGLSILQTSLPNILKEQLLALLNQTLGLINSLEVSMANVLNGNPGAVQGPAGAFQPVPLKVSVNAFKWMMDINLIVNSLKVIPADIPVVTPQVNGQLVPTNVRQLNAGMANQFSKVSLGDTVTITAGKFAAPGDYIVMKTDANSIILDRPAYAAAAVLPGQTTSPNDVQYSIVTDGALSKFELNTGVVGVYETSVAEIQKEGNRRGANGVLLATQGQENFSAFQGQLIPFLGECMLGVASSSVRAAVISEGIALMAHCDLSIAQDTEIIGYLNTFINTPIPLEDTLNQIEAGLSKLLKDLGLDRAADALTKGDFGKLFSMNGKNATFIGAALEALALLKQCFPNQADLNNFLSIENSIKGDQDLLNIKVTFDFDLAIFNNLANCANWTNLANLFTTKDFLCGLASAAGVAAQAAGTAAASAVTTSASAIAAGAGSAFSGLEDLLTTPDSPPVTGGVPAAPANVTTDTAAVALAAKTV